MVLILALFFFDFHQLIRPLERTHGLRSKFDDEFLAWVSPPAVMFPESPDCLDQLEAWPSITPAPGRQLGCPGDALLSSNELWTLNAKVAQSMNISARNQPGSVRSQVVSKVVGLLPGGTDDEMEWKLKMGSSLENEWCTENRIFVVNVHIFVEI